MILQTTLPFDAFTPRGLPGIQPLEPAPWLLADDAYAGQMRERARLLRERQEDVLWLDPSAFDVAAELLEFALSALPRGFKQEGDVITRPDGNSVTLDRHAPLHSLGHLLQEDLCLLVKDGRQHVLKGAVLCFPASWMLSEKAGHPLTHIHGTVAEYTDDIARRVQRLFDGVQVGRPIWRHNALWYEDPALFQPRSVKDRRAAPHATQGNYFRTERQVILRLPRTQAVIFSIHTFVLARTDAERLLNAV